MSSHSNLVLAAVKSSDANSSLIASWRRSVVTHGLHPDHTTKPKKDIGALRESLERHALLVAVTSPLINELLTALAGVDAVVMLADRSGLILLQRQALIQDIVRRPPNDNVGVRFTEKDVGTGPVGTVLFEERPMMFGSGECFSLLVADITTMGAPIFGPDGELVGVLACGYSDKPERHLSGGKLLFALLSQFARRIGAELFAKTFPQARLLQVPQVGGAFCALVAVGPDELVLGATRSARRLLGLSESRLATPLSVSELFGTAGLQTLQAAEAKLIAQSMMRYADNLSAAAKALGISRSTLYRKLDELKIGRGDPSPESSVLLSEGE